MEFAIDINDPVHGFISLTDTETEIIDTVAFQRLRYVKQLSGGHFVYPTAEHTRFSHSLGVMYVAGLIGRRIINQMDLSEDTLQEVRIAALLHDLGHGPFSHVFEEVLGEKRGLNHEDVTEWLIRESEIGDILDDSTASKERICDLVRGRANNEIDAVLSGIVAGQVDSDKMDYLIRDSFYCGVNYGLVDIYRLVTSIFVSDNGMIEFDLAARGALESFLVARYEMFLNVYYHKTVRSVEIMLIQMMKAADRILGLTSFSTPQEFLVLHDDSVLSQIRRIDKTNSPAAQEATELINLLDDRILYKSAFEKVLHTKDHFVSKILTKPKVRGSIEEDIASIADVLPSQVIVDVPTLPSVPYNPHQLNPMEVNIFELIDGKRHSHNLSDYSNIAEMMKVYLDVIRVYTTDEHRTEVGHAAREIFQEVPDAALIHM
ncbi:MAG: HD domain-containing protein [Candidatus Thorarchaeota archaeon]